MNYAYICAILAQQRRRGEGAPNAFPHLPHRNEISPAYFESRFSAPHHLVRPKLHFRSIHAAIHLLLLWGQCIFFFFVTLKPRVQGLQGYLAHKKPPPSRNLQ